MFIIKLEKKIFSLNDYIFLLFKPNNTISSKCSHFTKKRCPMEYHIENDNQNDISSSNYRFYLDTNRYLVNTRQKKTHCKMLKQIFGFQNLNYK